MSYTLMRLLSLFILRYLTFWKPSECDLLANKVDHCYFSGLSNCNREMI